MSNYNLIHFLTALCGVLSMAALWAALRSGRLRRLVNDLPTSKTTGVFIGLVELKGTAESETPLTSYLAGQSCVYYKWSVEEHWSRMVTETYTGSNGRTQTRTRQESGWKTVAEGGEMPPFYLKDDCIRVVNGFLKKMRKTSREEIELALKRMKEWNHGDEFKRKSARRLDS